MCSFGVEVLVRKKWSRLKLLTGVWKKKFPAEKQVQKKFIMIIRIHGNKQLTLNISSGSSL